MQHTPQFIEHLLSRAHIRVFFTATLILLLSAGFLNVSYALLRGTSAQASVVQDLMPTTDSHVVDTTGEVAGIVDTDTPKSSTGSDLAITSLPPEEQQEQRELQTVPLKKEYKIALYGDSMVDTMGENLTYLSDALKKKYPNTTFKLYNYGWGSQNVDDGIARWNSSYTYFNRKLPPITTVGADIIILGSFAYNPFAPYERDHHWLSLTKLVEMAKKTGADVYLMAEIAPLRSDFGRGPGGVNWDIPTAYEHSGKIIEQLENAIGLAKNLNIILINIFDKTITSNRVEGKPEFVSSSDGIHPSPKGHEFTAQEIVNTLILD